jgi:hypothetical protein
MSSSGSELRVVGTTRLQRPAGDRPRAAASPRPGGRAERETKAKAAELVVAAISTSDPFPGGERRAYDYRRELR